MALAEDLETYFNLQDAIFEAFGHTPQWRQFPLDDNRDAHWMIVGGEGSGGSILWMPEPFTREGIESGSNLYSAEIYTQRHHQQWVWRTETHVMALVEHADGHERLADGVRRIERMPRRRASRLLLGQLVAATPSPLPRP